ncbi:MAG: hypothetical protein QE277_00840 [Flectobacillus sp.]|nr:hypothetical protein [Flectobacillus sp.]
MKHFNNHSQFYDNLIVVIVLYNLDILESETYKTLLSNAHNMKELKYVLFIYDNSSKASQNALYDSNSIYYIHDSSNPGVGKAYNSAANLGMKLNKKWILLLDQDTSFPLGALDRYAATVATFPQIDLFCPILKTDRGNIFSPSIYKFQRGFQMRNICIGENRLEKISPVNSGLLINLKLFRDVDGYNEQIPLDFSDFFFIEKVRKMIDRFVVLNIVCIHSISNDVNSSVESSLKRFKAYCVGSVEIGRYNGIKGILFSYLNIVLRATILTIRYKTFIFYKMLLKKR